MWVRLLRADKKLKVGQVLRVTPELSRQMIEAKKAIEYTGSFPIKKMKTDFFKPKDLK